MEGYDRAYPENRVTGNLTLTINRNPSGPRFDRGSYSEIIPADYPLGTAVIFLTASDPDNVS